MKTKELLECLNEGKTIYTTGIEFTQSSITPLNEDDIREYIVEISKHQIGRVLVRFVPEKEFVLNCHEMDYCEEICNQDEAYSFIKELCDNSNIFVKKQ